MTMTTRAARRVARLDKKRREALPLFAATGTIDAVVPLPSEERVEAQYVWTECNVRAKDLRRLQRDTLSWLYWRMVCERVLPWEEIQAGEAYCRRVLPHDPVYRADHWHRRARRMGLGW